MSKFLIFQKITQKLYIRTDKFQISYFVSFIFSLYSLRMLSICLTQINHRAKKAKQQKESVAYLNQCQMFKCSCAVKSEIIILSFLVDHQEQEICNSQNTCFILIDATIFLITIIKEIIHQWFRYFVIIKIISH
jgi:hypothetical protein